jgi:predicted anti-sigma-YlaC factor YlaD
MASNNQDCRWSTEIATYLDGELDAPSQLRFEEHIPQCEPCAEELNEQRRLLCALDFALGANDPFVDLPGDFAQIVATNAESDMSGVRKQVEHRRALRFCIGLALAAFVLLGGATVFTVISVPVKAFARSSVSILGFVWNALYDAGVGASIIIRPLGRRLIFEAHPIALLALLVFAIALALLPRLLVRYHRAQITE